MKICDFGASRRVSGVDELSSSYDSNFGCSSFDSRDEDGFGVASSIPFELLGTEGYLSPEQLKGETLTSAIDMWAMGVLLYKCVTGESNDRNYIYISLSFSYLCIKNIINNVSTLL